MGLILHVYNASSRPPLSVDQNGVRVPGIVVRVSTIAKV